MRYRILALALLLSPAPALALELDLVEVRDAGNPPDDTGYGAVAHDYAISKYEITNAQYAEFLNAVATETDAHGLYNPQMAGIDFPPAPIGFERFYEVVPGFADRPVDHVSVFDAFRFANWLHNGQLSGAQGIASTESGAYTMELSRLAIRRNPGALFVVPDADEWYKAAYYDAGTGGYFDYPTGTDAPTTCATPSVTPHTANCESAVGGVTDVGAYTGAASPSGTFDQGGNVWEWTETTSSGAGNRQLRGGNWFSTASSLAATSSLELEDDQENIGYGFRIAVPIPEPSGPLLGAAAALALGARRRLTRSRAAAPRSPTGSGGAPRDDPRWRSAPSRR